ncbi:MAG: 16S rRNA (guanine(527)-N(7))-methyltransferase RsmG [Calditrichaeota bacterium]|nr:MAG: 16S rRNA (guanine(527)-N(7))-methyltransferase RsmG [Calditrichota bacterium]
MKQFDVDGLVAFLNQIGLDVTPGQSAKLKKYETMLLDYSGRVNLISSADRDWIVYRHFLESFLYVWHIQRTGRAFRIMDLGSGGGFPGIILALFVDDYPLVMVESVRKKTLFLKHVVRELGLNAVVEHNRIESLYTVYEGRMDVVSARALAALPLLTRYAFPFLKPLGTLHTVKGANYFDEGVPAHCKIVEIDVPRVWSDVGDYLLHRKYLIVEEKA